MQLRGPEDASQSQYRRPIRIRGPLHITGNTLVLRVAVPSRGSRPVSNRCLDRLNSTLAHRPLPAQELDLHNRWTADCREFCLRFSGRAKVAGGRAKLSGRSAKRLRNSKPHWPNHPVGLGGDLSGWIFLCLFTCANFASSGMTNSQGGKAMKIRFTRLLLIAIATVSLASVALAADTTTTFKVTGMYCSACETKIQHALTKTDGVQNATVSLDKGSATVTYDDAKVKPDQIVKVIEKEGYKAEPQQQKAR